MAIRQSRGITLGKGTPQRLEGQNGDITIRSSRKGLKLYVKESNKWHSINLGIDLLSVVSSINRLEKDVKRLSNKTNNAPVVDKLLLRQSGGTSAVGIQNKSGLIAFRNSTDTSEAKVQALPFDIGTNNTSGRGWGQLYYNSANTSHELESNGLQINAATNAPDSTEQALLQLTPKSADSIIRFNSSDGTTTSGKFIMGFDRLKADGSTSDDRFKINNGSVFADDSVFNLDSSGVYVAGELKFNSLSDGSITITDFVDEDNMASNSAVKIPTQQSVKAYVDNEVAGLVNSAPAALDTLDELAAALNDDASFSTTITNSLALKAPLAAPAFTGNATFDSTTLAIDATNNRVGIGTASPDDALDIGISGSDARIYFSGNAGGGGSGILYKDSSNSGRYALHFEDTNKVILSNRASNGTVQIRANTSTAGASGEQTIATFEDDQVSIAGNILVTGTVDGRDIATDGSKLDGIEAGATADQTQADINGLAITTTGALDSGSITSGFGNINTGSSTITTSGAITGGDITANGDFYGRSVDGEYSRIYRIGGIYFTWDSDSYGSNFHHSITSYEGSSFSDGLLINSFGDVRINIDSNNNGTNTFEIGHNTTDTSSNTLFTLTEAGVATFSGEVEAASLDISGDIDIDGTSNLDDVTMTGTVQIQGGFRNDGDIDLTNAAIDVDLIDNNASALSFDSSGKAGILEIVTTNDSEKVKMSGRLDVSGITNISGTYLNVGGGYGSTGSTLDDSGNIQANGNLTVDGDATFDTTTLKVDSSNNRVGIGTTSPDSILHISYNDNSPEGDISNNFNDVGLQIENTHADGCASIQLRSSDADGYIFYDDTGSNAGDMHFRTDGMNSLSVLTLKDDGKVGIGNESPQTHLDVFHTSAPEIAITGDANNTGVLAFGDNANYKAGRIEYDHASNFFTMDVAGTERFKLTSSTMTSDVDINLTSGHVLKIAGTSVLSNNTLGSGVVNSSLTSVGTISSGTWQGTAIGASYVATLNQDTTGTAAIATTVTVADESSDTTCFPLFVTSSTGNQAPKSGTNLTFDSANGKLTATQLAGDHVATNVGHTGNLGLAGDGTNTNTPAEYAALPVGYHGFMHANLGTDEGMPLDSTYFFFHKIANRDMSGGWGGLAIAHNNASKAYFGATTDGDNNFATWYKILVQDGSNNVTVDNHLTVSSSINLGHASDTTLTRASAGNVNIEGNLVYRAGGTDVPVADGGTGASNASDARSNLGVDAAGTDNSTNVTLTGTPDYITISGQEITRNQIDLANDVTGTLPVAKGGTGATSLNNLITLGTHTTGSYVQSLVAGNLIDCSGGSEGGTPTIDVDLSEAPEASIADGDYIIFLDGGATGTEKKEALHDVATLFAGSGLTATNSVLSVDTLNQDTTGNAATATALETARNIGGVSFDGTANINLPGVNTAGNQDTSGTAANATHVTVADNENTNENNLIPFIENQSATGNVGLESDGDLYYNPSSGAIHAGEVVVGNVDAVDGDFDGTLEADAITIGGVALSEYISDTVGAMFSGNTETRISATYDDSDNTIDLVVDDMTAPSTVTVTANSSENATHFITYADGVSGAREVNVDAGLTYNPSSNTLAVGDLSLSGDIYLDDDKKIYLGTAADNDYIYSDGSNINLAMDDSDVVSFTDSDVRFGAPIKIVKSSAAVAETSNHGQIWVDSNYNPSELSYTDTSGQDVRITNNGKLHTESPSHFRDVKIHQWYSGDANQDYIPFGASVLESSSTADSQNDDTLFIAPYDGTLEKIVVQAAPGALATPPGDTRIALRVNGTTQTFEQESIGHETTRTFTWTSNNSFSAGDRLRISFDPTGVPKYVTATSVWKYTL